METNKTSREKRFNWETKKEMDRLRQKHRHRHRYRHSQPREEKVWKRITEVERKDVKGDKDRGRDRVKKRKRQE